MSCTKVNFAGGFAIICGPDDFVNLEPFGSKVWMEWHHYTGPHFFRSKNSTVEIFKPSKKTWDAFDKWRESSQKNKQT